MEQYVPGNLPEVLKGTSLSHYRALVHILTYASQQKKDAVAVIQDGVQGGVINVFFADSSVSSSTDKDAGDLLRGCRLMPSSSFVAAVATATAEGYFCPSLPFIVEAGNSRFNFRSESFPRDGYTFLVLLFPDLFTDSQDFVENCFLDDTPSGETSRRSGSPLTSAETPQRGVSASPQPSGSPGGCLSSSAIQKKIVTSFDWRGAQDVREEIAVCYLSTINNSLYHIKLHQIEKQSTQLSQAGGGTKKSSSCDTGKIESAETASLLSLASELERMKALVLLLLCATSVSTAPGTEKSSSVRPPNFFFALSNGEFHPPFEFQVRRKNLKEHEQWLENIVEKITKAFASAHQGDPTFPSAFDKYLEQIRARSIKAAHDLSVFPTLVLHRPHDGHLGTSLQLGKISVSPVCPHMPIQPGETMFVLTDPILEMDSSANPLSIFLNKCVTKKLSSAELRTETRFMQDQSWIKLSSKDQYLLYSFMTTAENVAVLIDKNPEVLSQMIFWSSISSTEGCVEYQFSDAVIKQVLFFTEFNVNVGKFFRELVQQDFLSRDLIIQWIEYCCTKSSLLTRSFFALVDFVITRLQCDLEPELRQRLSKLRVEIQ